MALEIESTPRSPRALCIQSLFNIFSAVNITDRKYATRKNNNPQSPTVEVYCWDACVRALSLSVSPGDPRRDWSAGRTVRSSPKVEERGGGGGVPRGPLRVDRRGPVPENPTLPVRWRDLYRTTLPSTEAI